MREHSLVELTEHDDGAANTMVRSISKKNLNAPRPSEHPSVRGEKNTMFRWDHNGLQIQNLVMAFKQVPR